MQCRRDKCLSFGKLTKRNAFKIIVQPLVVVRETNEGKSSLSRPSASMFNTNINHRRSIRPAWAGHRSAGSVYVRNETAIVVYRSTLQQSHLTHDQEWQNKSNVHT